MSVKYFHKIKGSEKIIFQRSNDFDSSEEKLKPGLYEVGSMMTGLMSPNPTFKPMVQRDKLVKFKSGVISSVLNKVGDFFNKKTADVYKELKIFHSAGILFYGPPGTGKTCTCQLIMEDIVEKHEAICLNFTGYALGYIVNVSKSIRELHDNPIVVFVDEVENAFKHDENAYLSFLDGTDSIDKMLFMGCTNFLDKIPNRIKYRKSRIKHLYEIKSFPIEVYREYVIDRLPSLSAENIAEFTFRAVEKGLTLDQLKHSIIDFRIEGVSIEEAINGVLEEGPSSIKITTESGSVDKLIDSAFGGEESDKDEEDDDDPDEEDDNNEDL